MKKFREFISEAVDKEGYPEVHAHHEALKKRTAKEIHKEHQSIQGRVHAKYTAAEMGGKRGQIADILRAKHGHKKVAGYFKLSEEVALEESADADAAADIADHHGVSAQSTGAGHHSVSHPAKGSGFFDHHHAHAPLKAAGWKLKEKHKTESMEGGTYTKGEHTVQVMSRHNPHQNTIVHNIKKV